MTRDPVRGSSVRVEIPSTIFSASVCSVGSGTTNRMERSYNDHKQRCLFCGCDQKSWTPIRAAAT